MSEMTKTDQLARHVDEAMTQLAAGDVGTLTWVAILDGLPQKTKVIVLNLAQFVADMNQNNHARNARLTALEAHVAALEGRAVDEPSVDLETDAQGRTILTVTKGQTITRRNVSLTDQRVWRSGAEYQRGDGVTHDRSFWIAQVDKPNGRPGMSHDWRLAVARGKDGKDRILEASPDPPARASALDADTRQTGDAA